MFNKFIFDEISSELYNVMCVNFDSLNNTVSAGIQTSLNIERATRSDKYYITSQEISEPLSFKMQICKCDATTITPEEERFIKKWLCKTNVFSWMQIDTEGYENLWIKANISNPQLKTFGRVIGMEFTVTTNAPFVFTTEEEIEFEITDANKTVTLNIDTDSDYIYPTIVLKANASGNLIVSNSTEVAHRTFDIDNLSLNETIMVNNEYPNIETDKSTHKIYNDFNKHWLRLVDGTNTLTFDLNCSGNIMYREIRKVGIYT